MSWQAFLPSLAAGAWVTLQLTAVSVVLAAALAFAAGLARMSQWRILNSIAAVYITVFRGTSLLVQMFWLYFVLPLLGLELSAFSAACLALGLNIGSYGAEVVRGAIVSIPAAQTEAAVALNLSPAQRLFRILLPQALPRMMPAFGNNVIELLKGTALVSLITLHDLTFKAQLLRSVTYQTTEIFSLTLAIYFVIALALSGLMRLLEAWVSRRFGHEGVRP